jgi:hypothetical protein
MAQGVGLFAPYFMPRPRFEWRSIRVASSDNMALPGFAHMPIVEITGASLVGLPHALQFIATRGGESSVGAPFLCKKTRF